MKTTPYSPHGYHGNERILTPRQMQLIEEHLGEPCRTQHINPQKLAITGVPADWVITKVVEP